jgi:hypothetical protein
LQLDVESFQFLGEPADLAWIHYGLWHDVVSFVV